MQKHSKQYKKMKAKVGIKGDTKPGDLMQAFKKGGFKKAKHEKKEEKHMKTMCKHCKSMTHSSAEHMKHEKSEKHMKHEKHEKKDKHEKNWIAGAIKKPGALHRELGVKQGHKIPAGKLRAAAGKGGKIGARARLAETLKGFHKKGKK